jgi:hypothetical protein
MITKDCSLEAVLPRMLKLYEEAVNTRAAKPKMIKKKGNVPVVSESPTSGQPRAARTPFLG